MILIMKQLMNIAVVFLFLDFCNIFSQIYIFIIFKFIFLFNIIEQIFNS